MASLPLEGVRITDITVIWAGPYATWFLGSLGAEVIHVDNPHHRPDFARGFSGWLPPTAAIGPIGLGEYPNRDPGERPWDRYTWWNRYAWNRKACSVNLDRPEGIEVFKRLIAVSDIFIENNSATAMEHLGIGHDVLMALNPQLICINMPAYGRSGPYMDYVGIGPNHQAVAGEDMLRGYPDAEHPAHNGVRFHMDSTGGIMGAVAAVMGLIYRRRTGKGIWIDFAQIQSMIPHMGEIYMDAAWNSRDRKTVGNRHPSAVQGCYRCRGPEPTLATCYQGGERWVDITINNDEEWRGFCEALGNPDWTNDARFADTVSRYQHHDELAQHIEAWTRQHDNFEVFYLLQQHGVPAAPVEDWRDTYMDPQLNARDWFQTITHADCGTHRYPGFAWKFSETPLRVLNPPCRLNEHTEHVCKDILGMSADEYGRLCAEEIIGMDHYPWAGPRPKWG